MAINAVALAGIVGFTGVELDFCLIFAPWGLR
jgi:hypothetical protein